MQQKYCLRLAEFIAKFCCINKQNTMFLPYVDKLDQNIAIDNMRTIAQQMKNAFNAYVFTNLLFDKYYHTKQFCTNLFWKWLVYRFYITPIWHIVMIM